jgi:signal peptidase I
VVCGIRDNDQPKSWSLNVQSSSMSPTLNPGDTVKTRALSNSERAKIRRFSIVTFVPPSEKDTLFAFRAAGLPEETVSITDGKLMINGSELSQTMLPAVFKDKLILIPEAPHSNMTWRLGKNEVFVIGDNFSDANDSRRWGPLSLTNVIGVATAVIRKDTGAVETLR